MSAPGKAVHKLITTCLLIISFIFLCGVDACETRHAIEGTVGGDAKSDVTITLAGDDSDTTLITSEGSYSFFDLANGSYTITQVKAVIPSIQQAKALLLMVMMKTRLILLQLKWYTHTP